MTNEKTTKPEQGENPTKAELMEEENGLSEEINQAYDALESGETLRSVVTF